MTLPCQHSISGVAYGAAQAFATTKAPYLQYLEALKDGWDEARVLEKHLQTLARNLEDSPKIESHSQPLSIIELLDILPGTSGQDNVVTTVASLRGRRGEPIPKSVGSFLARFRDCKPEVHTRIIVLQSERTAANDRAADSLLFCHILGMELDLRPADVSILAQIDSLETVLQPLRRHALKPGIVSLGSMLNGKCNSVAAYLGRRRLGDGSPEVVVVHLRACRYAGIGVPYVVPGRVCEPPLPSKWGSDPGAVFKPQNPEAVGFFIRALRSNLQSALPLHADVPTGSWLSALVQMEATDHASNLDHVIHLVDSWSSSYDVASDKQQREASVKVKTLCASLKASIRQVAAFQKDVSTVPRTDYEGALLILERILGEAQAIAEEVKDSLDSQHQVMSIQKSELAINESRSAIAVTVLAFVFIPINLASSVYGMNVQEINDTGHSIWGFLVTALVLLTFSGLGWMCWVASRNWKTMAGEARRDSRWECGTLVWHIKLTMERFKKREYRHTQRLALFVGLRSIEKRRPESHEG